MFSRIPWESYQIIFPIIAFILIFSGFLFFVLKGIFMRQNKADRMSKMPLDEETPVKPGSRKSSNPPSADHE